MEWKTFYITSILSIMLIILFWLLHIFIGKPDWHCDNDTQCLNGGTCSSTTRRCECTEFVEYPYCDPVMQCDLHHHGFGIAALTMTVFLMVVFVKMHFPATTTTKSKN